MENRPEESTPEVQEPIKLDESFLQELEINPPITRVVKDGKGRSVEVVLKDFSDMTLRRLIRKNALARVGEKVKLLPENYRGLKEPLEFVPEEDDVWDATTYQMRVVSPAWTYPQWLFVMKTDSYLTTNINVALNEIDGRESEAIKNDSSGALEKAKTASLTSGTPENE